LKQEEQGVLMKFIAAPASVPLAYRVQDVSQKEKPEFEPWIDSAAASFETKLPIPASCGLFKSDGFFRLKRHHRSICFAPNGHGPICNVFCIKGMEPFAPDFDAALDILAAQRWADSGLSLLEHFILVEDKLPGCLLFGEACAEASIAAAIHLRLSNDGESFPRLPLPVLCVRLSETIAESAVRGIAARASRFLWPKIEMLAATGLGAYVYWYPSLPLRAADFRTSRTSAIAMSDGWIRLASRMLRAGFLPTSAHSLRSGVCCNLQNSVIDGGFADLGSVVSVADVGAREDVFIATQMTIWRLSTTIQYVLGHAQANNGSSIAQLDYPTQMILHLVRERLMRACGEDADPRLMQFFSATQTVGSVARFLDQTKDAEQTAALVSDSRFTAGSIPASA
jgi:hypothetical protein